MDGAPLGEPPSPSALGPRPRPAAPAPAAAPARALRWEAPAAAAVPHPQSLDDATPPGGVIDLRPLAGGVESDDDRDDRDDVPEEPLIGVVLGDRYRIDAQIGSGGMGLVYRATHLLIGRKLAIKVLRRRYAKQSEVAARFAQEARVASSVKHVHIVDLIDYGATPLGSPYCVMEYLDGRTLAREIASQGPLQPARALELVIQIGRGLAAAHQAGIIHRDLKPDNVFVVPADAHLPEQAKILDFGIAQVTGRKNRLTASGAVVGTPEYMSPEQARGDDIDARSDLYALGIVLFEALCGRPPLSSTTTMGTLTKQVYELPPRLAEVNPLLGPMPSVEGVLGRLLAKNRDERPSTAADALRLLQTAAQHDLFGGATAGAGLGQDLRGPVAVGGVTAHDLARRSTVMIGSGSVARAHEVEPDGPTTGSFAAKSTLAPGVTSKRPSIIIKDGVSQVPPPPPVSKTPTPDSHRPLGKPPRGGLRRRHIPLILIGVGAAIFAALVTIGFAMWIKRRGVPPGATSTRTPVGDCVQPEYPLRRSSLTARSPRPRPRGLEPISPGLDMPGPTAPGQKMR